MALPEEQKLILLVDDEFAIVKIISRFLEQLGYQVISTTNSVKALFLFQQNAPQIFLVITDLTMPEMSGTELVRKIRALCPEIPVILCTGYGETIGFLHAKGLNISACLAKPVSRLELASAVRKVLKEEHETTQML